MSARFVPSTVPVVAGDGLWIGVRGMDVLVRDAGDHDELPTADEACRATHSGRTARSGCGAARGEVRW